MKQKSALKKLTGSREFLLFVIVVAMFAIVSAINPAFFSFGAMKAAVMVIGGVIVYNGVSNLLIESRYRKAGR